MSENSSWHTSTLVCDSLSRYVWPVFNICAETYTKNLDPTKSPCIKKTSICNRIEEVSTIFHHFLHGNWRTTQAEVLTSFLTLIKSCHTLSGTLLHSTVAACGDNASELRQKLHIIHRISQKIRLLKSCCLSLLPNLMRLHRPKIAQITLIVINCLSYA